MVTVDLLKRLRACKEGLALFQTLFPVGEASFDAVVQAGLSSQDKDAKLYLAWLGYSLPASVPGTTWEARLKLQRNDNDRAWLNMVCPSGVKRT